MKKLKILKFAIMCWITLSFWSCSWFDSPPVEPEIIGVGYLKDENSQLSIQIDSVLYVPQIIYTGEIYPRIGGYVTVQPKDGMLVTCYKAKDAEGVQFILGRNNAKQIEDVFHTNDSYIIFVLMVLAGFILCFLTLIRKENKNKKYKS